VRTGVAWEGGGSGSKSRPSHPHHRARQESDASTAKGSLRKGGVKENFLGSTVGKAVWKGDPRKKKGEREKLRINDSEKRINGVQEGEASRRRPNVFKTGGGFAS